MSTALKPFEFLSRRAITETATGNAACWYDSAEDVEEEELAEGDGYFDLDTLPDAGPYDIFSQNNRTQTLSQHNLTNNRYSQNIKS